MTYEELVGQKLVWGIEGTQATPEVVRHFQETHAGGLILFRRNIESADGVRRLITDLEHALGRRLLVMIDHEGGRVIHLGEGTTVFPDAQALGLSGKAEWARQQGEIEGLELRRLGMDLNLAPVLDVLGEAWNPAIGTRSYGKDPGLVAALGRARIVGMQSRGLSACAKHFPGLGAAEFDPHYELPVIRKSAKAIREEDLRPFLEAFSAVYDDRFAAGVDCVMSSHPVYPELDSRKVPATFSRTIIHDWLRLDCGFKGLALTDDLKMGAIGKSVSLKEAGPLAAGAGHDLLLVCSDTHAQLEVFESLVWAHKKKELKTAELETSVERIQDLKKKRPERFEGFSNQGTGTPGAGSPEFEKEGAGLARKIARSGVKILGGGKGILPLSGARGLKPSLLVLFPNLGPMAQKFYVEPGELAAGEFLKQAFQQFKVPLQAVQLISLDPSIKERQEILEKAARSEGVLFFCADAHLFPGTKALLQSLPEKTGRLAVVLLREPHDFEWLRPGTACVTAHGFRLCQIEAALERLFSPA